jgi:hypothetical protein
VRGGAFGGYRGYGGGYYGGRFYGGYGLGFGLGFGYGFGYPYYGYGYGYGYPYYGYGGYGYGSPYYDPYYSDPYAYSYGGSPYGGAGYAEPYAQQPAQQYAQQPAVVNQSVTAARTAQPTQSYYQAPDFYLIAFDDHTIRAALTYRVEGSQIHWTSREHEEKSAPVASVDRRFTEQINRDRHVEFRLP